MCIYYIYKYIYVCINNILYKYIIIYVYVYDMYMYMYMYGYGSRSSYRSLHSEITGNFGGSTHFLAVILILPSGFSKIWVPF